jgi:hypothetical protein
MLKLRRPRLGALNLTLLIVLVALAGGGAWLVVGSPAETEMAASATADATKTDVTSTVSADTIEAENVVSGMMLRGGGPERAGR